MPTNAERVQRAIDWAAEQELTPTQRAELALICELAGVSHETVVDVITGLLGGATYTNQCQSNDPWVHALMTAGAMPALVLPEADGYALTHAIFGPSNYGRQALVSEEAVSRIQSALDDAEGIDLRAEYAICLYALGEEIDPSLLSEIEAFYDGTWTGDYHPYFVCAILFALLG